MTPVRADISARRHAFFSLLAIAGFCAGEFCVAAICPSAHADGVRVLVEPGFFSIVQSSDQTPAVRALTFPLDESACLSPDSPAMRNAGRQVLELMILCAALSEAGIAGPLDVTPTPSVSRELEELQSGGGDVNGNTLFHGDVVASHAEAALSSSAVVRKGEFRMGIFTAPARTEILNVRDSDTFRALRGVAVAQWSGDVAVLNAMDIAGMHKVPSPDLLIGFIAENRADFTFCALNEPLARGYNEDGPNGLLTRVDGYYVVVADERRFYASPRRPDIVAALDRKIARMRAAEPDEMVAAYQLSGFFWPESDHWINLSEALARRRTE